MELIQTGTNTLTVSNYSQFTKVNLSESKADNTVTAYESDLKQYRAWLDREGIEPNLPHHPAIVADYLSYLDMQNKALSTIHRHRSAISFQHRVNGFKDHNPARSQLVFSNLEGIAKRRVKENRPTAATSKDPARADVIRAMVSHCPDSLLGVRDKALLLVGFAAALRRSELVALHCSDIRITGQGADIFIRSSKTDQLGQGETVSIVRGQGDSCPVMALVAWLEQSGIRSGPVFRHIRRGGCIQAQAITTSGVAKKIKEYCRLCGLDPARFSGHSLRSGVLTSAAESGADVLQIAQHARHSLNQAAHYVRHANRYKNNITRGLL